MVISADGFFIQAQQEVAVTTLIAEDNYKSQLFGFTDSDLPDMLL